MDLTQTTPLQDAHRSRPTAAELIRLWRLSSAVYRGRSLGAVRGRLRFVVRALIAWRDVVDFLRPRTSAFGRHLSQRPETIGAICWPFIHSGWPFQDRLRRIRDHFAAVETAVPVFDILVDDSLELFTLEDNHQGLSIVLDQARWFMREGQLVLNLFQGKVRLFSIAFALRLEPELVAYIGAIQGRNLDGVLETYRQLTTQLHGMRPRDFLFESFRTVCRSAGVSRILAVADAFRQHRDPYFGSAKTEKLSLDYDEIWQERGGVPAAGGFYVFSVNDARRDLADIPSKKRSMYRKRYALMDDVQVHVQSVLGR